MTEGLDERPIRGWVFYDGACSRCTGLAHRFSRVLGARDFSVAPLQAAWVRARLGLLPGEPLTEMKVLTHEGRVLGGAEAAVYLARKIWWASPLWVTAHLPLGMSLLRRAYAWAAANRTCLNGACALPVPNKTSAAWIGWLPLGILPVSVITLRQKGAPWAFMWTLSIAIFAGCKWITWWRHRSIPASALRHLGYLLAWPGMDAESFLSTKTLPAKPRVQEWALATLKTAFGATLLWVLARRVPSSLPLLRGWIGLWGLIFLLHFGTFHIVALLWQTAGVDARPLMFNPALATSLGDFWGKRWNLGFHAVASDLIYRPLRNRLDAPAAMLASFLASGLIHDLVISLPASAGYGLPTAYFGLQAAGLLLERSEIGKRCSLGRRFPGWLFTVTVAAGPAFWLFHPWFVTRVVVPFLQAVRAL